jgi:hypothetical protein
MMTMMMDEDGALLREGNPINTSIILPRGLLKYSQRIYT